jgi:hypothetical protein
VTAMGTAMAMEPEPKEAAAAPEMKAAVPDISLAELIRRDSGVEGVRREASDGGPVSEVRAGQGIGRLLQAGRTEVRPPRHGQGKSRVLRNARDEAVVFVVGCWTPRLRGTATRATDGCAAGLLR